MTITTRSLDKAAFLLVFGGKLGKIEGKYPDTSFEVTVNRFIAMYEAIGGAIPYRHFTNKRRYLKRLTRRMAGLPEYFTGNRDAKFTFADLAIFTPWKHRHEEEKWPRENV